MHLLEYICITYTVKPLASHICKSTTPYIDHFIWVPNNGPYNTIIMIFKFPKLTTSLNEPLKVGPMVGRIREVLERFYCVNRVGRF